MRAGKTPTTLPVFASQATAVRLLIAESSSDNAEEIVTSLTRSGHEVSYDIVDQPASFVERLQTSTYDLVICNHDLHTWTGFDALQLLRKSSQDIPFLVVTAVRGDETAVEYIRRGAANYVLRDHLERLPIAVEQAFREVAARKETVRLQEQIVAAKRDWERTFDAVADPIIVIDDDCLIRRANIATCNVFGRSFAEIIGKPCYEVIHGRSDRLPTCPHQCLLKTGHNAQGDIEEPRLGKTFHSSTSPLSGSDGTLRGCVHVLHDVTQRKQTEAALRRQALTFENMSEAVTVVDGDGNVIDWNQAATRMFGYQKAEMLGRNASLIHPAEEAERHIATIRKAVENGRWDGELIGVHKDGTTFEMHTVIVSFHDECGRPAGAIAVNRDITERKAAEKALKESEEKYRQLFENACYGIYHSQLNGQLLTVNPAFVRMLGYSSKEEVLKLNLETDVYQDPNVRRAIVESHVDGQERAAGETFFKRKDGSLVNVRINGRTIPAPQGEPPSFEVIVEDVTETRDLEEQLRQAQKMEAVGRLAGGIAHDFNNVVMIVNSYAELITTREPQDEAIQRYAEHIIRAGKKASSLTRQLLAFSRKQTLQPKVLDLASVVLGMSGMLRPMLGDDIHVTIVQDEDLGRVHADRAQIEQVIMNLVVNARDAMPKGGKLQIELHNAELDEHYTRLHPQISPGKYVVVVVSDTGIGMDAATQANIFEPFFTTKEVGKGTGLGLSTVYGVVKQSGGFVWVYSEPGLGTTFKVYLPRVYADTTPMAAEWNTEPPNTTAPSATILLVDDEYEVRCATGEFLEGRGYRVLQAEDATAALVVCNQHQGTIDILVTDLIMPGMRGQELAAEIAKLHPETSTIFMSGYTDRSQEIEALGPNVIFLQKPFSLKILEQKLQAALRCKSGGFGVSPSRPAAGGAQ